VDLIIPIRPSLKLTYNLVTKHSDKVLEFSIINGLLHQKEKLYVPHGTSWIEFYNSTSTEHSGIAKITYTIEQLYW
jgi:hypothetical protein